MDQMITSTSKNKGPSTTPKRKQSVMIEDIGDLEVVEVQPPSKKPMQSAKKATSGLGQKKSKLLLVILATNH